MQNGLPGFTSEQHLFDLPINGPQFSTVLQQTGTISGKVQLTSPDVKRALLGQPPLHLLEDKTAIYVELNGSLVWGGILQQVQYDSASQQADIRGVDWWGYFNQGRVITWNSSYTNIEQLVVAADLVNIAQGSASSGSASPVIAGGFVVGGNVGVTLGPRAIQALAASNPSGVNVTVGWAPSSYKSIGQAISDMGIAALGFDWSIDVFYDGSGTPVKQFNLWYPRAGRTQQQQQTGGYSIVFDMGSTSGLGYTWPSGQVPPANVVFGAGSGGANVALGSEASDPSMLSQGWPVMEKNVSFTDVSEQGLLDGLTLAHLYATRLPVSQPTITYSAGSDSTTPLGSFMVGDDVRLMIPPDPYFQSGYDSESSAQGSNWWRVQQVTVSVHDEGKSSMAVVLGLPPIIPGA